MKFNFLIFLILTYSCTTSKTDNENRKTSFKKTLDNTILDDDINPNTEIIEIFVDSLNIGKKGETKIELIKHRVFEDIFVILKFYTKAPNNWSLQNTYIYECETLIDLFPKISDYNNDQFNDISFISATAARSSNEVRRLFIYDDQQKQLISIANAENYPNMLYNKELDCIDALLFHGGSTTVFLKIEGDSLIEFAKIDNANYRSVFERDKFGKYKLIRQDTIANTENIYIRYINYKPLKEYKY